MAWQTPKIDWSAQDGVRDSDLNRIEGNILALYETDAVRADKTIYVDATGSDGTGTGTASSPYASINKAISVLPKNLNGKSVAINIAAGTYNEDVILRGYSGPLILTGGYNTYVNVNNFKVEGCICVLNAITISTIGRAIEVTNGATVVGTGGLAVSGAPTSLNVTNGSRVSLSRLISEVATNYGLFVDGASHVSIGTLSGDNNAVGIIAQGGSIVAYTFNNMTAYDRDIETYSGGRVYSGSSASVLAETSVE